MTQVQALPGWDVLKTIGIESPSDPYILIDDPTACDEMVNKCYSAIRIRIASLPKEEPFLATRLHNEMLMRARNVGTCYVYRSNLPKVALLYIDFTGLRDVPEPKEEVVSRHYTVVKHNASRRGGEILYGGLGGDDAFAIAFQEADPALQCGKDIKPDFCNDLFLNLDQRDVKFGLSYVVFEGAEKEQSLINCWGNAKDCCEFKTGTFRNRGNLLISARTLARLKAADPVRFGDGFKELEGETLKSQEQVFVFSEIQPLR